MLIRWQVRKRVAISVLFAALAAGIGAAWWLRVRPVPGTPTPVHDGGDDAARLDLSGRVVDLSGRPVAGARLRCTPEAGGQGVDAVTDEAGRFALRVLGEPQRLRVEAAGFGAEELRRVEPPAGDLEITLYKLRGLEGVVRAGGRPAAEATVVLRGPSGTLTETSGPDGAFQFRDLAEGIYALRATRGDEAAYLEAIAVQATDAGVGLLSVELQAGVRVTGRLLDGAGRPIAGGEVTLAESAGAPLPRRETSGAGGAFTFRAVLPGTYLVWARAPGHYGGETRTVPVPPGRTVAVELRLERGAVIAGRVLDEAGRPVAGAHLEVSGETADGAPVALSGSSLGGGSALRLEPVGELGVLRGPLPFPPRVPLPLAAPDEPTRDGYVTDAKGAFRLEGLPPGRLVVAATHPDHARAVSEPLAVEAGRTASVELVLSRGQTVRGRVLDEDGGPLAGAEVRLDGRVLAVTDKRGEFVLEHLKLPLRLEAHARGHLPAGREVAGAGEIELRLERAAGGLEGVVVDDRGLPIAGARVEAAGQTAATDRAGRFRIEGLGAGGHRVEVTARGFAPRVFDAVPLGEEARLELAPGAGLSGEVRDARTGAVPAGLELQLALEAAGRTLKLAHARGRFEEVGLAPGRASLRVTAPGYVAAVQPLELPAADRPGEVTVRDLRVDLERGGVVRGRVVDDFGQPARGAKVSCGGVEGRTDARGEFRLDGVPAGRHAVQATLGALEGADEVSVRAADETEVALRIR